MDEAVDPDNQQPEVRGKKSQRDIKFLADALNPQNYDMIVMPSVALQKERSVSCSPEKEGKSTSQGYKIQELEENK